MNIPVKPFYFIRHGETDWNRRGIYMGSKDIPLNETGSSQAELAARTLQYEPILQIVTSPLSRALKTAEIISNYLDKPLTVIDELRECSLGMMEGKDKTGEHSPLEQWLGGMAYEGAETVHEFDKRVMLGLTTALELNGPTLIVSHGGVYASIRRLFDWPFINITNCSPYYHRPPEHEGHPWFINDLGDSVAVYDDVF